MKFFVSVFLTLVICGSVYAQPTSGTKAPEIALPNAKGELIKLSSLKGKVVLIDFWASWCGPCRASMPGLKKVYKKYHDKGFEIYSISLDESDVAWKKAVFQDATPWIHVNDKQGNVANAWTVSYIPTTYLLDASGDVKVVNAEGKDLETEIQKLLK